MVLKLDIGRYSDVTALAPKSSYNRFQFMEYIPEVESTT